MPSVTTAFQRLQLLLFGALALLVGNAAAGLASGLAGGLALAATAVLCAVAQVLGFQSLNLHGMFLHIKIFSLSVTHSAAIVNS